MLSDRVSIFLAHQPVGQSAVPADEAEGFDERGYVQRCGAIPVTEAGAERELFLRPVEVVFVEDEGVGEDGAQEAGEGGFAAGGGAGEPEDGGFGHWVVEDWSGI